MRFKREDIQDEKRKQTFGYRRRGISVSSTQGDSDMECVLRNDKKKQK